MPLIWFGFFQLVIVSGSSCNFLFGSNITDTSFQILSHILLLLLLFFLFLFFAPVLLYQWSQLHLLTFFLLCIHIIDFFHIQQLLFLFYLPWITIFFLLFWLLFKFWFFLNRLALFRTVWLFCQLLLQPLILSPHRFVCLLMCTFPVIPKNLA